IRVSRTAPRYRRGARALALQALPELLQPHGRSGRRRNFREARARRSGRLNVSPGRATQREAAMKIRLVSIFVDDQDKALKFYTDVIGFVRKHDVPAGGARWITLVSPEGPAELELVLEPNSHPAARAYQEALLKDGIPVTAFESDDVRAECERLKEHGVVFT